MLKNFILFIFKKKELFCESQPLPALVAEHLPWWPSCLDRGALNNGRPRMWYVGGSRPDGAQVGRFSSWGIVVPKGFLAESAYFSSLCRVLIKEAILV